MSRLDEFAASPFNSTFREADIMRYLTIGFDLVPEKILAAACACKINVMLQSNKVNVVLQSNKITVTLDDINRNVVLC